MCQNTLSYIMNIFLISRQNMLWVLIRSEFPQPYVFFVIKNKKTSNTFFLWLKKSALSGAMFLFSASVDL